MRIRFGRNIRAAVPICSVFLASALLIVADDPPQFSAFSVPKNLGPIINTSGNDSGPCVSRDGLTLYFNSDSMGGFGGLDIYVSHRAGVDEPWGPPQNLGSNINSSSQDFACVLSPDEHRLYFSSNRPGGFGLQDLYVARRHNKRDDSAWQPAENLGGAVNSSADEAAPVYFEDDITGNIALYFHSNRPGGMGGTDIYVTTLQPDEAWRTPVLVKELSSPFNDIQPAIRRDGLEMFVSSNRPGSLGLLDVWVSMRASTSDPWSIPVNLGSAVNSAAPYFQGRPSVSFDGSAMYFYSFRPGGFGAQDLYVSTRTKLKN